MNQIVGAAVPSGENAAMVSNVVGYVESGSRVDVRINAINVNFGLAKAVGPIVGGLKALGVGLARIGDVLVRLLPNEWNLSFSIGHSSNTSARRLN